MFFAGVSQTRPLLPEFGAVRESIPMPNYPGTLESFLDIVEELRQSSFRPGRYHLLHRNCNHFSEALLQAMYGREGGARVPSWVNRAANVGSGLSLGARAEEEVVGQSFPAPGKAKPPSLPSSVTVLDEGMEEGAAASSAPSLPSSLFNWFFGSSTPSSTSGTATTNAKTIDPKKKKELTEKQKAMLSKFKSSNKN